MKSQHGITDGRRRIIVTNNTKRKLNFDYVIEMKRRPEYDQDIIRINVTEIKKWWQFWRRR